MKTTTTNTTTIITTITITHTHTHTYTHIHARIYNTHRTHSYMYTHRLTRIHVYIYINRYENHGISADPKTRGFFLSVLLMFIRIRRIRRRFYIYTRERISRDR